MKTYELLFAIALWFSSTIALAQKPKLVLPVGHTGPIQGISFSPDSRYIVTASSDKTAKIWDVKSCRLLYNLEGHTGFIFNAIFSPDSKSILTNASDGTAKVWSIRNGEQLITFKGRDAIWSPDGNHILTRSGSVVEIWAAKDHRLVTHFRLEVDTLQNRVSIQYSPDGNSILTNDSRSIKIWDANKGDRLVNLSPNLARISSICYSPDGKKFAATSDDTCKVWDSKSGRLLVSWKGGLNCSYGCWVKFSPDGKTMLTVSPGADVPSKFWDSATGKLLFTLKGHASYSPDGRKIGVLVRPGSSYIMDAKTGKTLTNITGYFGQFSPDGKIILSSLKLLDAESGKELNGLKMPTSGINSAQYSPDFKSVLVALNDKTAKLLDPETGNLIQNFAGHPGRVINAVFSPDGLNVVTASKGIAKVWNVKNGNLLFELDRDSSAINPIPKLAYSPDGNKIVGSYGLKPLQGGYAASVWNARTGGLSRILDAHKGRVRTANFSPDSKALVTASLDKTAIIWNVENGKIQSILSGHKDELNSAIYSSDGKSIITTSMDSTAKIWDAQSGKELHSLGGHKDWVQSATFSPDNKRVVTSSYSLVTFLTGDYQNSAKASLDKRAKIWSAESGKLLTSIEGHSALYSPDGERIITTTFDNNVKIWSGKGELLRTIVGSGQAYDVDWGHNTLMSGENSRLSIYDMASGEQLLSWISIDSNNWVVSHPSGLFDASPGAMDKLYFVAGLDIIEFSQLKTRYYEPGLWKKVMNGEKLRDVVGFNEVELPPDVLVGQVDKNGNLPIEVINRGGGIGVITLYINGKETIKDIRKPGADTRSARLSFTVPVSSYKGLLAVTPNLLAVKAWNANHWIESRGSLVEYVLPARSEITPAVHVIVCGVSDYTGNEIDLKYAAKDAEDMAKALTLGTKRLFGVDRSYVYTLTTNQHPGSYPTKTNIINTFEKISLTASAADVIVVYLSGHGINIGGADGDFHYLTQEAYTASADAYNDPAIKGQATLSSQELVELFKKVPALKQVLMIDACASGKVVDNLMARRDVESGTLRALDRMKDRTGMHIIAGCTADAVSYEASRYGQGVLTYSLLEGLRGQALREDRYVDVNKLFQFAQERVPELASGIGGIQVPQVFSPNGSQSFDFGELTLEDKRQIPIAKTRPVYVRSNFIDDRKFKDVLSLGKRMDDALNEASAKGESSGILFTDVSEYPEGCQLSGQYRINEGGISLSLNKTCEGKEVLVNISGRDAKEVVRKIMGLLGQ